MLRSVLWSVAVVLALVLAGALALPPVIEAFGSIVAAIHRAPLGPLGF